MNAIVLDIQVTDSMPEPGSREIYEMDSKLVSLIADWIEKGSAGKIQITARYVNDDASGVCAIGAMILGAGKTPPKQLEGQINFNVCKELMLPYFPEIGYPSNEPLWDRGWEASDLHNMPLDLALIMLNDAAGWTFERQVMWLRGVATQLHEIALNLPNANQG